MITCKWRHSSELMPNAISYSRFGQAKCIILQYSIHLVWFCPLFFNTFPSICPHFGIYVQILKYMSTFPSICRRFQVNVHIFEDMSFFSHYYPMFVLWYWLMSRTSNIRDNKRDFTNKTFSSEETSWEEQDKTNQKSICDVPDFVQ